MTKEYLVLTFYCFVPLEQPETEVVRHKNFFEGKDATGRIYISSEGINAQLSGRIEIIESYRQWLEGESRFKNISFKLTSHHENIFPRMTIKARSQLVAFDCTVDPKKTGNYLCPQEWKETLEGNEPYLLLDVRNNYEWEIGHFEGARLLPFENFREFPSYADKLKEELDPKKDKILMYCTGGIRCELYSAFLKEKGFEHVYQLEGGVIHYGQKEGKKHWKGKLFVFDDRLAVEIDEKESEAISQCRHCLLASDTYYNCANMDCNALFLCCPSCLETYKGCCAHSCREGRLRPYVRDGNKPFCRKHLITDSPPR